MRKRILAILICLLMLAGYPVYAGDADAIGFELADAAGRPGDTVEVELSVSGETDVTAVGLALTYDSKQLTFLGFSDYGEVAEQSIIGTLGFDNDKCTIALGYAIPVKPDGKICTLSFRINDGARGDTAVTMTPVIKCGADPISAAVSPGTVRIESDETTPTETVPTDETTHETDETFDTILPVEGEPITPEVWPFTDVPPEAPYYDAVRYVYENRLCIGVSDTEFAPDVTMTRAMFVTVLGRMAGAQVDDYAESLFDDVPAGEWYSAYVGWASSAGIVLGYGDGTFGPTKKITVEQAAVIIARYAAFCGLPTVGDADLTDYADGAAVPDWAASAVQWAITEKLYEPHGTIDPQAPAQRWLVASMLRGFNQIS